MTTVNLGEGDKAVQVTKSDAGIQFRIMRDTGTALHCVVPGDEWFKAWDKLKTVRNGDVHQWSFIDEAHKSMVLVESYVEIIKSSHQVQLSCNVVSLRYSKAFKDMKTLSESSS